MPAPKPRHPATGQYVPRKISTPKKPKSKPPWLKKKIGK